MRYATTFGRLIVINLLRLRAIVLRAAFALAFELAEHWVSCREKGRDAHGGDAQGRVMAVCFIGPHDLAARLVGQGWAVADRRVSDAYAGAEAMARKAAAGLWRGRFTLPWKWPEKR